MEIYTLPQYLKIPNQSAVQVFRYRNDTGIKKTKINLTKHTFSFLKTGIKEVIGKDKTVKIDQQQFVLMKAGNCLMTEKISAINNYYASTLLFFDNTTVLNFLERYQLYTPKVGQEQYFHTFGYDDFTQHFVQSLEQISHFPIHTQENILKAKFEEIMLYLTHHYGTDFLNSLVQYQEKNQLQAVVENNRYNKLSIQELAFLSNMSVSTFKREFFKIYEETPMKWFQNKRFEHIALLLKTQSKRPIEVYEDAGYENFSNFVQAFKKHFGLTPKQYQHQTT